MGTRRNRGTCSENGCGASGGNRNSFYDCGGKDGGQLKVRRDSSILTIDYTRR